MTNDKNDTTLKNICSYMQGKLKGRLEIVWNPGNPTRNVMCISRYSKYSQNIRINKWGRRQNVDVHIYLDRIGGDSKPLYDKLIQLKQAFENGAKECNCGFEWGGKNALVHYHVPIDWQSWDELDDAAQNSVAIAYEKMARIVLDAHVDLGREIGLIERNASPSAFSERQVKQEDLDVMVASLDPVRKEANRFNLFSVLNISRMEIRHSNMLAWLLNANERHGFGGRIVEDMLKTVGIADVEYDWTTFQVFREWHNIDVLLVSRNLKVLVAIENKVGAHEVIRKTKKTGCNESQLETYCKELDQFYGDFKKHLIFLTPDGCPPTDERWQIVTYEEVLKSLQNHYEKVYEHGQSAGDEEISEKKVLIKNYIETIEREVLMKIDNDLKEKCRGIYNSHRAEIEFVLKYGKSNYSEEAEQVLKGANFADVVESTGGFNFRLKKLDEILPAQKDPVSSWWGNSPYNCYLVVDDRRQRVCCCMGLVPVKESSVRAVEDKLLAYLKKGWKNKDGWMVVPWRSGGRRTNQNNWQTFDDGETGLGASVAQAMEKAVKEFVAWAQKIPELI